MQAVFSCARGTLEQNEWYELRWLARFWLSTQGGRDWSQSTGRFMFGVEFVADIDEEIGILSAETAPESEVD
jgi:hypothetical protein